MNKFLKKATREWLSVYRYNGGILSLLRCLAGTFLIKFGYYHKLNVNPKIDCITFSVLPRMTALWAIFMERAIGASSSRLLIGDCSGALKNHLRQSPKIFAIPCANYHHGEKLDIFLQKVCIADYVLVTDDDIFWLDQAPWHWGIEQLDKNTDVAVASLYPKKHFSKALFGKVKHPMGSCFILRRRLWLSEGLSFKLDFSPILAGHDFGYDTGESAQVELLRRGYEIVYAPSSIQSHFVPFRGLSVWALKIQHNSGNIVENIRDIPVRQKKALHTILSIKGLSELYFKLLPNETDRNIVPPELLDIAEGICKEMLPEQDVYEISREVDDMLIRVQGLLEAFNKVKC